MARFDPCLHLARKPSDTTLRLSNQTQEKNRRAVGPFKAMRARRRLMMNIFILLPTNADRRVVISCPCALILAIPTAMVAAISASARLGILIKNVADLEIAAQ